MTIEDYAHVVAGMKDEVPSPNCFAVVYECVHVPVPSDGVGGPGLSAGFGEALRVCACCVWHCWWGVDLCLQLATQSSVVVLAVALVGDWFCQVDAMEVDAAAVADIGFDAVADDDHDHYSSLNHSIPLLSRRCVGLDLLVNGRVHLATLQTVHLR